MEDKFIINFCPTGAIHTKEDSKYIPITTEEIVNDCKIAIAHGAQIMHIHARDAKQVNTLDHRKYAEIIKGIRELPGGNEVIITASTSGRFENDIEKRSAVFSLEDDEKPDMASLTLSSLNFINSASVNAPKDIVYLAEEMEKNGVKPEVEIFDLGMINYLNYLIKKEILSPPYYINIILGNIFSAQPKLHHLSAMLNDLPENSIVTIGGMGQYQTKSNTLGLLYGDGVRIGLEDNIYKSPNKELQSNSDLIKNLIKISDGLSMQPMPLIATRKMVFRV